LTVARPRYIGALLFALGFYIKLLLSTVSAQWGERREFRDYKAYNKHQLFFSTICRSAILTFAKVAQRYNLSNCGYTKFSTLLRKVII